jgi:hypothetical protein
MVGGKAIKDAVAAQNFRKARRDTLWRRSDSNKVISVGIDVLLWVF